MQRLFVGLPVPADIGARLHLLREDLPGARWTPLENYHITLAYIGEADETMAGEVKKALSSVRQESFALTLKGMGSFAQADDADVLWAGVEKNTSLLNLKEKISAALEKHDVPFDKRSYAPHITLARFRTANKDGVDRFMKDHALFTAGPFEVETFILYESHITESGPVYEQLADYPLMLPHMS